MLQEGLGRGEVRVHRIVDVGQADFHRCLLGPNGNQFAAARFFDQAWNEVWVPGAEHQVRPQDRHGQFVAQSALQHFFRPGF